MKWRNCFFTDTKEPDGKVPDEVKMNELRKELSKLNVHKVSKRCKSDCPITPYTSREDINDDGLQFHLDLDDDRFAPKKV